MFRVQVEVDPSQALGAAKTVGAELGRTEAAGVKAGKNITDGFDKAAMAARRASAAFKSVADGIRAQALSSVSAALAGLTKQFEHEAAILRQLRGPMDDYKRDLEAINMLHKRGVISAREYGQAMAQARQGLGGGSVTSNIDNRTGKTIGAASGIGDKLSGIAAAAAPYAAGAYAGKQVLELADAHTSLVNRLDASTGAARRNNRETMTSAALYDRLHDVAQDTRTGIDATTTSYLGLSSATSKLGISQEQTIKMTETLNKLTARADSQQRDAGLRQLGQALSSGRLQGDEFKSISENLPELRDALAESLGVGVDKLREMSTEGKLTSKVLVEAFGKMGNAADEAFASSKATFGDRLTTLKNTATKYAPDFLAGATGGQLEDVARQQLAEMQAEVTRLKTQRAAYDKEHGVGGTNRSAGAFFGASMSVTVSTNDVAAALEKFNLAMAKFRSELALIQPATVIATQAVADYKAAFANARAEEDAARKILMTTLPGYTDTELVDRGQIPRSQAEQDKLRTEYARQRLETPGAAAGLDAEEALERTRLLIKQNDQALKDHTLTKQGHALASKQLRAQLLSLTDSTDYYKRVLDDIFQPQKDFAGSTAALNGMFREGVITLKQYNEEWRKLSETYDKSGFAKLFNDATIPTGFRPSDVLENGKMRSPTMDEYNAQRRDYDLSRHDRSANAALGELERDSVGDPVDASPNLERDLEDFNKATKAAEEYRIFLLELTSANAQWEAQQIQANDHVGQAWDAMVAKATDVAGALESTFTNAYQGIEDAVVSMAHAQEITWRSMKDLLSSYVDMMIAEMTRLMVRSAISGIAGAFMQSQTDSAVQSIATEGALGDLGETLFDPTWGGPTARTAQPTSPTIGPAATGGVSARQSSGQTVVVLRQDPDSLLPALDRSNGRRVVANIAYRDANPAKRPRYN